jgi:prepilin-type N-terminal cleavage/methylation domain-containing protein
MDLATNEANMQKLRSNQAGFTLLELIVTLIVVGLLVALLVINLSAK